MRTSRSVLSFLLVAAACGTPLAVAPDQTLVVGRADPGPIVVAPPTHARANGIACMRASDGIVMAVCETDADCAKLGSELAKCSHVAYSGSRSRSVRSQAFKLCALVW